MMQRPCAVCSTAPYLSQQQPHSIRVVLQQQAFAHKVLLHCLPCAPLTGVLLPAAATAIHRCCCCRRLLLLVLPSPLPAAAVGALVLGSGHVPEVQRVINDLDDFTAANMLPGDPDLTALIPGYETYDATVLEFDVVPAKSGELVFQYIFASEGGCAGTHASAHIDVYVSTQSSSWTEKQMLFPG